MLKRKEFDFSQKISTLKICIQATLLFWFHTVLETEMKRSCFTSSIMKSVQYFHKLSFFLQLQFISIFVCIFSIRTVQ